MSYDREKKKKLGGGGGGGRVNDNKKIEHKSLESGANSTITDRIQRAFALKQFWYYCTGNTCMVTMLHACAERQV